METMFGGLRWRCIGPHRGGRVVAVAGHPTNRETFFFGAVGGGIWKTTDGGVYWKNISDGYFSTAAIGALAVSTSDPNVMFAGTGETAIRGDVSHGDGVYRTTDAGRTWKNIGLSDTRHIAKVRIHPENPDIVYVAAFGHAWGRNEDRGVYRSFDGGDSWSKVLYKSDKAGAIDLTMDIQNPQILYAAIWEAQRHPHTLVTGGDDSGLWRSTDGGDTWEDISQKFELPNGPIGKIGVAASPARPGRVWALIGGKNGALFRSDDYGENWRRTSDYGPLRQRSWYYSHIYADPQDENTLWVLNGQCWKSIDGGLNFVEVSTTHGDNHDLWIDPLDSNRMIEGNDGGASVTFNGGRTWSSLYNQPTAQFYHASTDERFPYWVYGSQQDNTAIALPSMSFDGVISQRDWIEPGGGESGYIAIQPKEPHYVFGGALGMGPATGKLNRYDPRTGQIQDVSVWPEDVGFGRGAESLKYRFQWTFPIEYSPHDPDVLYTCSQFVHRSVNSGHSWEIISPDLTRNDPDKLGPSGGPVGRDNSGAEIYCTIFAFHESPHEKGLMWAGSDDGLVHLSHDGGKSWQNVTPPTDLLPEWALISILELSPHDPATAYIAATRYKLDDNTPYLFKTNDYGQTWKRIANGIPDHDFTRTIREDPHRRGLLYAGTETGLYISFDDGEQWQPFQLNLPVCPIYDIIIKDRDLIAATHGRSLWILDDLSPLHEGVEALTSGSFHLFEPRPSYRLHFYNLRGQALITPNASTDAAQYAFLYMAGPGTAAFHLEEMADGRVTERFLDVGANPPEGVLIYYTVPEDVSGEVRLDILADDGQVIRTFSNEMSVGGRRRVPTNAGLNLFVWDMGHEPPETLRNGGNAFRKSPHAPVAFPGEYQVRLSWADGSLTQSFDILPDPRLQWSPEELKQNFDFLMSVSELVSEIHSVLNQTISVRNQIDQLGQRIDDVETRSWLNSFSHRLVDVEQGLLDPTLANALVDGGENRVREKLISLFRLVGDADAPPTQQSVEYLSELTHEANKYMKTARELLETDLPRLNEQLIAAGVPLITATS